MSTLQDIPALADEKASQHSKRSGVHSRVNSYSDEKHPYESGKDDVQIAADVGDVGDVYEDVRAIDLDDSGKEKPIGKFDVSCMPAIAQCQYNQF